MPKTSSSAKAKSVARLEWIHGSMAISADQATCWGRAANDLARVHSRAAHVAARELVKLGYLPDADALESQIAAAQTLTLHLDIYFGTPGLYR
jgi:hypothetical protein